MCVIRQSYALVVFLRCLTYEFSSGRLPLDGVTAGSSRDEKGEVFRTSSSSVNLTCRMRPPY
jgi:hypothetical protein